MNNSEILDILKVDLQISSSAYDTYLSKLIELASSAIEKEGIKLTDSNDDGMLVEMYAAFLFRRRKETQITMPRILRYNLNNRLFSQKARGES